MARITFASHSVTLFDGESVLSGLLRAGAEVAYSCRKGTCQVCVMQVVQGDPGDASRRGIREDLRTRGCFLPCQSYPDDDLVVTRPDPATFAVRVHVKARVRAAPDVVLLDLEPETNFAWRPGQFVNVMHANGSARSYSIASVPLEDPCMTLHVRTLPGGVVSSWLGDEVAVGDVLTVQGPQGTCVWDGGDATRPLVLIGTGTGLAPLFAIARGALFAGHTGEITLFHGARTEAELYLDGGLRALAERFPNFAYMGCVSGAPPTGGHARGRALDVARAHIVDLTGTSVFLAGHPTMVEDARVWAYTAGAAREHIHADPFELKTPYQPADDVKLARIAPDLELWTALDEGKLMRAILEDFYTRVYADPRLEPFFHKVTKEHAIGKQYAFLADLITGRHDYFGLKPFNAHHWMVISDELFDYRESLITEVMRARGLEERYIRRWGGLHETFRRELVKQAPRGLMIDGVEQESEKVTDEMIEIATVCDACGSELGPGAAAKLHWRTGQLYCGACARGHGHP